MESDTTARDSQQLAHSNDCHDALQQSTHVRKHGTDSGTQHSCRRRRRLCMGLRQSRLLLVWLQVTVPSANCFLLNGPGVRASERGLRAAEEGVARCSRG